MCGFLTAEVTNNVRKTLSQIRDELSNTSWTIRWKKFMNLWTNYWRKFSINVKQTMKTKLIVTALVAFILTGLFPPWQYTTDKDSDNGFKQGFGYVPPSQGVHSRKPAGYSLFFTPPVNPDNSAGNGVQIDFGRLSLEWVVLAVITGMVWIIVVKPAWAREDKSNRSQKFISPRGNPGN